MKNTSNLYRGHTIDHIGHGKRALFRTTINDKPHETQTLSTIKADIDRWIDAGEAPESAD
jgi:hypothetical protein